MVIIDTSVVIDHLRQDEKETLLMRLAKDNPKENLAISVVSVQELFEGRSTQQSDKRQSLLAVISPLQILPYDYETARLAGEIARDLGRPVELADAAIAATAINNGARLLTLNRKDFRDIAELELLEM